ncbi:MAG TPA: hypothetical protein VFQ57_04725 [Sphingomonas sp.]|jgi:hypothetical protein|nr:hypothetical protein [Sphingomonas sp.]
MHAPVVLRPRAPRRCRGTGSTARRSRWTDSGKLKLNSFTLKNVGGYSLAFDADKSEFKVARQGVDITAAIFAGKAFS